MGVTSDGFFLFRGMKPLLIDVKSTDKVRVVR